MTSNLGSHIIQDRLEAFTEENASDILADLRNKLIEMLRKTIRPEFLNRVDDIIVFKPLLKTELRRIVDVQLEALRTKLAAKELKIEIDDDAKDWLAKLGYDVTYGARPLKRTIQKYIINPLSQELLKDTYHDGDTVKISIDEGGHFIFTK